MLFSERIRLDSTGLFRCLFDIRFSFRAFRACRKNIAARFNSIKGKTDEKRKTVSLV
jgi:hypothetical protein